MTANTLAQTARQLATQNAPQGADVEDLTWFAASVLHDLWLMPTCLLLEAGQGDA